MGDDPEGQDRQARKFLLRQSSPEGGLDGGFLFWTRQNFQLLEFCESNPEWNGNLEFKSEPKIIADDNASKSSAQINDFYFNFFEHLL